MPIGTKVMLMLRRFRLRLREARYAILSRLWAFEKSVGEALVSHADRHLPSAEVVKRLESMPIYEDRY